MFSDRQVDVFSGTGGCHSRFMETAQLQKMHSRGGIFFLLRIFWNGKKYQVEKKPKESKTSCYFLLIMGVLQKNHKIVHGRFKNIRKAPFWRAFDNLNLDSPPGSAIFWKNPSPTCKIVG